MNACSDAPPSVTPVLVWASLSIRALRILRHLRYLTRQFSLIEKWTCLRVKLYKVGWETAWLICNQEHVRLSSEDRQNICAWWAFRRQWLKKQEVKRWIWKTKPSLFASMIWNLNLKERMCHNTIFLGKMFLMQIRGHWIHCWFVLKISAKWQL